MKIFKQLLRKALNLIQGMEMMNQVLHLSIISSKRIVGDPMHLMQSACVHKGKACAPNFSHPQGYMQAVGGFGPGGGNGVNFIQEMAQISSFNLNRAC